MFRGEGTSPFSNVHIDLAPTEFRAEGIVYSLRIRNVSWVRITTCNRYKSKSYFSDLLLVLVVGLGCYTKEFVFYEAFNILIC